MSDDDDPCFCPGDSNVEALGIVSKANASCRVCPDEGDDHEVSLLSLRCVNGADLDRLIPVLGERVAKKFVLSSVRCEHQHRWSPARVNPMHLVQDVLHCVSLHLVRQAVAVRCLLSTMDVEHSMNRVWIIFEFARVLGTWPHVFTCWPWDSLDGGRREGEAA